LEVYDAAPLAESALPLTVCPFPGAFCVLSRPLYVPVNEFRVAIRHFPGLLAEDPRLFPSQFRFLPVAAGEFPCPFAGHLRFLA